MSRYHGPGSTSPKPPGAKNKGVAARVRAEKRAEAEARNAVTPLERRAAFRRSAAA
jgi:hypothetical protein